MLLAGRAGEEAYGVGVVWREVGSLLVWAWRAVNWPHVESDWRLAGV